MQQIYKYFQILINIILIQLFCALDMFIHQFPSQKSISSQKDSTIASQTYLKIRQSNDIQLDATFRICDSFMKLTGHQFLIREVTLMEESNQLLQNLKKKISGQSANNQLSFTKDTIRQQPQQFKFLDQDDSKSRIGLRKVLSRTKLTSNNRVWPQFLQQSLRQIEQNCSKKTLSFVNNVLDENKKLSEKISENQKKQANIRKKKQFYELLEKQNMKNIQTINQHESKIRELQTQLEAKCKQIENIHAKCSQLENKLQQSFKKAPSIKSMHQADLAIFLREKESILKKKQAELRNLDNQLVEKLTDPLIKKGCEKCCTMMKSLKQSIMKYKSYIQQQMEDLEKLCQLQKKKISKA